VVTPILLGLALGIGAPRLVGWLVPVRWQAAAWVVLAAAVAAWGVVMIVQLERARRRLDAALEDLKRGILGHQDGRGD
jgi:hypothetical protein